LHSDRLSLAQVIFIPIAIHNFMPIIAHYFSLPFGFFNTSASFVHPLFFSVRRTHVASSLTTVTLPLSVHDLIYAYASALHDLSPFEARSSFV